MPPAARRSDGGGPCTDSEPAIAREASCQNGTGKLWTRGPRSQADGTLTSRRLSELRMPNMRVDELQHLLKHTLPLRVVQNLVIHLGIPANLHRALESVGERSPEMRVRDAVFAREQEQQRGLDALAVGDDGSLSPLDLAPPARRHQVGSGSRHRRRSEEHTSELQSPMYL